MTREYDAEKHCGMPRRRGDGAPCTRPKGWGTPHLGSGYCKWHLGNTPQHLRAGARVMAQAALTKLGMPIEKDPQTALIELVWEAAGNVAFLRQEVGALEGDLVSQVRSRGQQSEAVRALVELYGAWTDKLAKYSKAAIDAGIAERQVQLAEAQGYAIRDLIEAVLDALDINDEQRKVGREVASSKLRVLAGGMAA